MNRSLIIGCLLILCRGSGQAQVPAGKIRSGPRILIIRFGPDYDPPDPGMDTVFFDPDRPLAWSDFTGTPHTASQDAAVSFTSFAYTGIARQQGDTLLVTLTLQVYFIKSQSWANAADNLTDYSLQHEQTHFNLDRVAAENFRNMACQDSGIAPGDADSFIQYKYIVAFQNMNHIQEQFDQQSHSGLDVEQEARWVRYARNQIRQIYSGP